MAEYKAQLLAVDAKLAKDPENEDLLSLKADLMELIELSSGLEGDEEDTNMESTNTSRHKVAETKSNRTKTKEPANSSASGSKFIEGSRTSHESERGNLDDKSSRRPISEAELLAKKKEKNRKKKAKLRERIREQLDIAESEKQSWQSFANKKGLKGVTKKSIFASPCSVTGKVGVGTNGIADAPSAAKGPLAATLIKRKH